MIREHRLINARAATITTDPTQYNSRNAQLNYDQQVLQHQAQLAANQAQTTGLDLNGQGTLAAPVAAVPLNGALANAQNTYANQAAGLQSQITQSAQNGQVVQSPVMTAGNGELQQNAIDRLRAAGKSDSEIRSLISDPAYLQRISDTMSNTGNGGTFDPATGLYIAPKTSGLPDINSIKGYTTVVTTDPSTGRQVTTLMEEGNATKKAQQDEQIRRTQQEQNNIQMNQKDAKGVEDSAARAAAANAAKDPGLDAAFAALIGGTQDPALQSLLTAVQAEANAIGAVPAGEEMSRSEFGASADAKALANPYDATQKILDNAGKRAGQFFDQSQTFLKEQQDRNDKLLAAQQANVQEQMTWQEQKLTRDLTDANRKELDRMTVSYALRGGYGSDDANNEVSKARWEGEQAITDLQKEFGFKRTDVALQFTDLTQKAHDQYTVNWLNAQNNLEAKLSDLDIQGIANQQAKGNAIAGAYKGYIDEIKAGRKEYAGKLTEASKLVYNAAVQERSFKFQEEQYGMQQLKWVIDTYGQNAPQSLLDGIAKTMPGVDVGQVVKTLTLAQQKAAQGSGGGGGFSLSFPGRIMDPTGNPPSFESFLHAKEEEAGMSFDEPKIAELRKEYAATLSQSQQNNPNDLVNRFEQRAAAQNLSGPVYKRNAALIDQYMKSGQYEQAAAIIDNIGDDIDSTTAMKFTQALTARTDIVQLHQAMIDLGSMGPITGRINNLNPYDPKVVRVNRLITQAVPNLARGVFNEVGVLTDTDVARYTSTLENPKLTVEQAQQTFDDLLKKLDVGMQNQLSIWDAQNKRTSGFKKVIDSQPGPSEIEDPNESFAQFILSGQ